MRPGYTGWTFLISVMSPPDPPSRTGPDPAWPAPTMPADPTACAADSSCFGAFFATSVFSAVFFGSGGLRAAGVAAVTVAGPDMYAAMPGDAAPAVRTRTGRAFTCVTRANNTM